MSRLASLLPQQYFDAFVNNNHNHSATENTSEPIIYVSRLDRNKK